MKNRLSAKKEYEEIFESAEIKIKYEGYIEREKQIAEKIKRLENIKIPEEIIYNELLSISTEGRQKLSRIKPVSIGQASRISGVSPSDINILLMYLGR
jgi:tRNA uridine 5-carboxymethylaminomethyl modification enzyme